MTSSMTQPTQRRRKFQTNYGLGLEQKKNIYTKIEGTSPDMTRGGGCAIRPTLTQKWAAVTYLAIGTTKQELRRDTTTKIRNHKPQIYTSISPGCVILCTPGDNRWFVRNAQNYHRGVVSCGGGEISCTGDILCQLRYIINSVFAPYNRGSLLPAPFTCFSCILPCASVAGGVSSPRSGALCFLLNHAESTTRRY